MYDLGENFKFDLTKAVANPECIFKGNKYRITVLTERLVRLEYNQNGVFEDSPTELVLYRNFPKSEFTIDETNTTLKIITKYFELTYLKEKSFKGGNASPMKNLKIKLLNSEKIWYYGHPEVRNFVSGSYIQNNRIINQKGLYSLDGFSSIDDSKTSLILENGSIKKRDSVSIDTYVFLYNKDFYYCLNDYFMLTGYPPLVPRYALGNWWYKDDFYSEEEIAHITKKFEANNIPISVFMLNRALNDFEFSEYYKDPKLIPNYFHSKSIRLGLGIEDFKEFKNNSKSFNKVKDYLTQDKNGNIPFNLFDAKTIDAFFKLIIQPLNNYGIDFYSLNSFDFKDSERLMILKHYLYYHNSKTVNKRPMISAYNGKIATHRYPITYAGKTSVTWEALRDITRFNISLSNLGISFMSQDIGGTCEGIEDNELFTRFVQLGVFSPILRLGSESGKYYKREPWKWGLKTGKITTDFLRLRHELIPYIYTEAYKYFKYGKPLIEPIYYRYPKLYDSIYNNQYFFGSTFLVSPILTKKEYIMNRVIQKIYMPEGIWYGFFTGKKYNGNKKYTSFYRDEEYPVFVKAGAIIPMANNVFNGTSNPNCCELQIFPGASNTYSIYEDDGETNNYLKEEYLITNVEFVYEKDNYKLTILPVSGKTGVVAKTRNYKIKFRNTKLASNIVSYVGSTQVKNKAYTDDVDLIIEVENVPTTSQLTIVCSGKDIEVDASRIIGDDIVSIISDLPIKTFLKQRIDDILFSQEYSLKKKRIEIRKLAHIKDYLEKKYIQLFLKLLEYIEEV